MRTEDGRIIQECLNGKPQAFGILVDKYREGVYAFSYAELRDFQDAQDVTQEVFLQAYQKLRSLRNRESFAFWLYRIAYRYCVQCLRDRARRVDRDFIEDQDPRVVDAPSLDSHRESQLNESVQEALDMLPDAYREVLLLHYFGGLTIKDIARATGTSPAAIGKRLSRGRAQLKEEMIAMMDTAFDGHRLPIGFTFRIVEAVKRIKISPMPRMAGLPWGLSLATVTIITIMSLNPHLSIPGNIAAPNGSLPPVDTRVLKRSEIPVDILKTSEIPVISTRQFNGDGLGSVVPGLQNALFIAPQADGGTWTKKADMPTARSVFATAVVNGKIYAIGGWDHGGPRPDVEKYDPIKDKWEIMSSMPQAKRCPTAISFNGKIYVFGGWDKNLNRLASVHEYDPTLDKWTTKRDMPEEFCPAYPYVLDSKIYVLCVKQNADWIVISTRLYEFDPSADSWTEEAKENLNNRNSDICLANEKLYFIGGFSGGAFLSRVEEYDPITDTWKKKSDMLTARAGMVTHAVGTKIYAMGGLGDRGVLTTVEIYDTLTDTWTKGVDMQIPRFDLSASIVGGKIYSIGGDNDNNILSVIEEFDTGFISKSVDPNGRLPKAWGKIKSAR